MAKAPLMLGNVPVTSGPDTIARMATMLWGPSGAGKTTFAATAPGDKLWLSFGDQEHVSVMHRKDVHVVKLYDMGIAELFKHVQNDNPLGLDKFLAENQNFHTVVCDSITAIAYRALQKAVLEDKVGQGRGFTPTMEAPGIAAYGGRNAIVIQVLTGLLKITAAHNVHFVATAHEDDPTTVQVNGQDVIDYIGVMLGGKIVNNTAWRFSEIWYMSQEDTGDKLRRLAIRATRKRKPMKSRMFVNNDSAEFRIDYDAEKPDKNQMTIASWVEQWENNGYAKLPIPQIKGAKK